MRKRWFLAIGLALLLTTAFLAGCSANTTVQGVTSSQQQGIWVTGTGKVAVVPDVAALSVGIEAQEVSVAEAQSKAAEAMNQVMGALDDNGVAEKDIQTQYFSIYQVRRWDDVKKEEVVVGYRVTDVVTAKIRNMNKVGAIIDAVAKAGGDLTRINGISFSVDDPSAYYGGAREKAVADAKARAQQLAQLSGVKLGKVTYISESVQTPPPIYRSVFEGAPVPAPTTPISPGETEISLSVQVVYAILD